jgi:hypothetical protein
MTYYDSEVLYRLVVHLCTDARLSTAQGARRASAWVLREHVEQLTTLKSSITNLEKRVSLHGSAVVLRHTYDVLLPVISRVLADPLTSEVPAKGTGARRGAGIASAPGFLRGQVAFRLLPSRCGHEGVGTWWVRVRSTIPCGCTG